MPDIARCRELLGPESNAMSDDEILTIRDFLTVWADIACTHLEEQFRMQKAKK